MPKYRFPLEAQDDYKGRVYFTQIIEIPPKINTAAFKKKEVTTFIGGSQATVTTDDVDFEATSTASNIANIVTGKFSPGQTFRGETVELYLPPAQTIQDGVEFDNAFSFGIAGEAARQTLSRGESSILGASASALLGTGGIGQILSNLQDPNIARVAAAKVGSMMPGGRAGAVTSTISQTALNPNIRAVFKSVRPREHSFSFKFLPRSEAEAKQIENIIKWFRTELYPESIDIAAGGQRLPIGYKFPNKFGIALRYGNKNVGAQLLPCYLRGMTTNYNATAMSFYRDGQYSEIDLTLDMIEFRTLDKDDVRYGWNLYGKNYKDFWEEFLDGVKKYFEGGND